MLPQAHVCLGRDREISITLVEALSYEKRTVGLSQMAFTGERSTCRHPS